MVVTFLLTVFVDLITAVAVEMILASFVTARWMETEQLKGVAKFSLPNGDDPLSEEERALLTRANGDVALFLFRGSFSYASARELARRAGTETAGHSAVVYDFSDAGYVDTSVALSVDDLIGKANAEHLACFVSGVDGPTGGTLQQLKVLDRVPAERRFKNRVDAVRAAVAEAEKRKLEAAA